MAATQIRHESVITALIGAALGLPLGIFLALLATQARSQYDIAIAIPILPARRASRLNVLDALHYE
jgi:putative ABC transport system permease protein